MSSHRAYLSKAEVDKVDQLEKAYTSQDGVHNFACSGIFPLQAIESEKLALYYGKPQDGTADGMIKCVTFPLTDETAKDVYNVAQPSPFGRGTELVYDETYRQAHEIKPPYFALSSDILSSSGLLALLAKKLDYEIPLAGRVNKLNAYTEGGFLNPTKNHIGTLMICLPSPFISGDLVIRQNGATVTFNWAKQVEDGSFAWGFLYSDCEHEVRPVNSGTRITISYDIYVTKGDKDFNKVTIDTRLDPIFKAFQALLDPNFCPSGGKLAFGFSHGYPFNEHVDNFPGDLSSRLKGSDALLLSVIRKLGLKMDYFAVYDYSGDDDEEENSSMEEDTNDAEGDMDDPDRAEKAKIDTTFRKDIWIADSVFTAGGSYVEYGGGDALGLDKDLSLIWVTLPGSYATANSYVSYGNNPQSDSIYCAVAMKVTLPRADKRAAYTPV